MRARDLAGFGSRPGAAEEETGAAEEDTGAAEEDTGAAEEDTGAAGGCATEIELAACICSGLWRRYAIGSTPPQVNPNRIRFVHDLAM